MTSFKTIFAPWTFGFIVASLMLLATSAYAGFGNSGAMLSAALAFGAISVVVGIGQMFVIASGGGNIDLSVPSVLTLAAYVSMEVMNGADNMVLPGLLAALSVGAAAGLLNFLAIRFLRLPPIIATLSWSFIFQSFAFNLGGETTLKPPTLLSAFTTFHIAGIQIMPVAIMLVTGLVAYALYGVVWGRQLLAIGQSENAARLSGVMVHQVRALAYIFCGAAAGLAGYLLSGFSGGAALNMGDTYLMESIAVVVLGGTAAAGGQANAIGIWGSALFFNLMAAMLNTFRIDAGFRFVIMGLLIIAIVAIAPRKRA